MAEIFFHNGRIIGDYHNPYFIAEVNSSHNGSIEKARQMVDMAKQSGADCVKFQSWTEDTLYSKSYYDANPIAKRMVKKFSLSESELESMAEYCAEKGVDFSSTPYSEREVDFLASLNVPFIKIASMEINNYPFLKYIAKKGLPIVMSTGMADIGEIKKAVEAIECIGNKELCLLHCVSVYPASVETINLNNMLSFREEFPEYPIGYSDHTLGVEVPVAAVALGACLIEKHFTLDSTRMGWDNDMAMEPAQFEELVRGCKNANLALGNRERKVLEAELKQRETMRRSVVAATDILQGHMISANDLVAKRPGTGLPPEAAKDLIGRSAVRNIEKDTLILLDDIK